MHRSSALAVAIVLVWIVSACAPAPAAPPTSAPKPAPTVGPAPKTEPAKPVAAPTTAPAPKPTAPTAAPKPAFSFAGKTVTVLVPFSAGGGADIMARLVQPFLQKYLPGSPTVLVQNMPGGSSLVGANWVNNAAPKDGTVIGQYAVIHSFVTFVEDPAQVKFDLARMRWLAGMPETAVTFAHANLGLKSADDLPNVNQRIVLGESGPDSIRAMPPRILLRELGKDLRFVTGFGSSGDMRAALRRAELNMTGDMLGGYMTAVRPMIQEGLVVPLAQIGISRDGKTVRDPVLSDLPTFTELLLKFKGEAIKQKPEFRAAEIVVGMRALAHSWAYAPDVPMPAVEATALAFERMFADPELAATLEKSLGFSPIKMNMAQTQQVHDVLMQGLARDPEAVGLLKQLGKGS